MTLQPGVRIDVYDISQQFKHVAWVVSATPNRIVVKDAQGEHRAFRRFMGDERFVADGVGDEHDGDYLGFPPSTATFS